jgi:hypothetical protein
MDLLLSVFLAIVPFLREHWYTGRENISLVVSIVDLIEDC